MPGEAAHRLWEQYVAHWHSYPDAYEVFRGIAPPDLLQGAERYPRENDADEKRLAEELLQAASLDPRAAVSAVLAAEDRHADRKQCAGSSAALRGSWLGSRCRCPFGHGDRAAT